jgi:hypothetical protein
MGLLTFLKRSSPSTPQDLRSRLIALVIRKDLNGLAQVVREQREIIVAEFNDWMTVPQAMQEDQTLLAHYAEMLLAVARVAEHDGDPSLLTRLEGDPADAPVETWNEQMAIAASLSGQQRFADAVRVLESLADRMEKMRGSAVDFYRPRVLGKLGIALFQAGDADRARDMTRQARDICRQLGDEDGVQAYETNLANMGEG